MNGRGGSKGDIATAKQEHNVIMTPNNHLNFDYSQSEDKGEPFGFGNLITVEKVYSFNPTPKELRGKYI